MPTTLLLAPEDLRPSYGPEVKGNITRHFLQHLIIELSQRCYTMELNYFRIIFEVALCKFDYQEDFFSLNNLHYLNLNVILFSRPKLA